MFSKGMLNLIINYVGFWVEVKFRPLILPTNSTLPTLSTRDYDDNYGNFIVYSVGDEF